MRTLVMVVLVGVVLGGVACGPKRVRVANTPEGQACRKECNTAFNDCYQGKRRNQKLCTQRETECLLQCPGATSGGEESTAPAAAPAPEAAPADTNAPKPSCVASELPEWQGASAAEKKALMEKCRAPAAQ